MHDHVNKNGPGSVHESISKLLIKAAELLNDTDDIISATENELKEIE